jgi:hypothetical protein
VNKIILTIVSLFCVSASAENIDLYCELYKNLPNRTILEGSDLVDTEAAWGTMKLASGDRMTRAEVEKISERSIQLRLMQEGAKTSIYMPLLNLRASDAILNLVTSNKSATLRCTLVDQ